MSPCGTIAPSAAPGCSLAAWQLADGEELDRLAQRRSAAGVDFVRTARHDETQALRFVEPVTGAALAFEGPGGAASRRALVVTHTCIQRLEHVVFATPQADAAVAWAWQQLDFRVSDWIDGGTTFLRPALSPFHHGLGVARAPSACLDLRSLEHLFHRTSFVLEGGQFSMSPGGQFFVSPDTRRAVPGTGTQGHC